ncbi:MAG TPA: DUF4245 family protein [Actinomycetes bacterium]|nr:DUF4245 family protein [Actinomycetes bacterium]
MSTTAPPPPVSAEPDPPQRPRRGFESLRDMVLSIALVGLVVLGVFWVVAWQRPEVQGPVRPDVDVAQLFGDVRVSDPFPVLEPTDLSGEWEPTSAWFEPASVNSELDGGVLHVGYLTPDGSYAEVRETNGERKAAIAEWVDDATVVNDVTIGDREWDVVASEETGKQGLVTTVAGTTVVVTGKAEAVELEDLAASLR